MEITRARRRMDAFMKANGGRAKGWTYAALARDLGISKAYLSQIVNGRRSPSLRVAVDLEQATGIPAEDFLPRHRRAA